MPERIGTSGGRGHEVSVNKSPAQIRAARRAALRLRNVGGEKRPGEGETAGAFTPSPSLPLAGYAPRLEGPVLLGPFLGAAFAAFPAFSPFPPCPRAFFGEAARRSTDRSSATDSPSPASAVSAFSFRTVSTRPPVARRARSASDSLRGAFSLTSNL